MSDQLTPGFYHYHFEGFRTVIQIYMEDHPKRRLMSKRIGSSFPTPVEMLTGQIGPRIEPWRKPSGQTTDNQDVGPAK